MQGTRSHQRARLPPINHPRSPAVLAYACSRRDAVPAYSCNIARALHFRRVVPGALARTSVPATTNTTNSHFSFLIHNILGTTPDHVTRARCPRTRRLLLHLR